MGLPGSHFSSKEHRDRCLAKPGHAGEKNVIEDLPPVARGLDSDAKIVDHLRLPNKIIKARRAQASLFSLLLKIPPGRVGGGRIIRICGSWLIALDALSGMPASSFRPSSPGVTG